eukprot:m.136912 g.136912  ORF g.136912 m.136912 type:complete len:680 (-) comp11059_c0_seq1:160-2199(-)
MEWKFEECLVPFGAPNVIHTIVLSLVGVLLLTYLFYCYCFYNQLHHIVIVRVSEERRCAELCEQLRWSIPDCLQVPIESLQNLPQGEIEEVAGALVKTPQHKIQNFVIRFCLRCFPSVVHVRTLQDLNNAAPNDNAIAIVFVGHAQRCSVGQNDISDLVTCAVQAYPRVAYVGLLGCACARWRDGTAIVIAQSFPTVLVGGYEFQVTNEAVLKHHSHLLGALLVRGNETTRTLARWAIAATKDAGVGASFVCFNYLEVMEHNTFNLFATFSQEVILSGNPRLRHELFLLMRFHLWTFGGNEVVTKCLCDLDNAKSLDNVKKALDAAISCLHIFEIAAAYEDAIDQWQSLPFAIQACLVGAVPVDATKRNMLLLWVLQQMITHARMGEVNLDQRVKKFRIYSVALLLIDPDAYLKFDETNEDLWCLCIHPTVEKKVVVRFPLIGKIVSNALLLCMPESPLPQFSSKDHLLPDLSIYTTENILRKGTAPTNNNSVTLHNLKSLLDFLGSKDKWINKRKVSQTVVKEVVSLKTFKYTAKMYADMKQAVKNFHFKRSESNEHGVCEFSNTSDKQLGRTKLFPHDYLLCYESQISPKNNLEACRFLFVLHSKCKKSQRVSVYFTDTHYGQYLPVGSEGSNKTTWSYDFVKNNCRCPEVQQRMIQIAQNLAPIEWWETLTWKDDE